MKTNPVSACAASVAPFALFVLLFALIYPFAAHAAPFAYISNSASNNVSVIDVATNAIVATITVGANPTGIAVSFDGTRVFVANTDSNNVSVIDTATNAVIASPTVGNTPGATAVNRAGTRVYVANAGSNSVSVIDTATNSAIAMLPVGIGPNGIAVNPAGTRVYVANRGSNSVSVIDATNNTVIAPGLPVGLRPTGIAINRDGSRLYVSNDDSNSVSVIDTSSNSVIATIAVGDSPTGIALSPDSARAYVANFDSNSLSVIDTTSNAVLFTLNTGGVNPIGVAVTPDGARVYVANRTSGGVSVIDTLSNAVSFIAVGLQPVAFGQFILGIIPGAGQLQFSAIDFRVDEGLTAIITVVRRDGNEGAVSVQFATSNGSAVASGDYTATSGTLNFAAGVTSQSFSIAIGADGVTEGNETLTLTLSNAGGGATLGSQPAVTLTISDRSSPGSVFGGGGGCVAHPRGTDTCLLLLLVAAVWVGARRRQS